MTLAAAGWQIVVAIAGIGLIFGIFGVLLFRARRTHTHKVGGRSYWDIVFGRDIFRRRPR
ncbi:MAG: hypothetical protein GY778_06865 [bacterium]|nr:hypothetical protein [bacterium]